MGQQRPREFAMIGMVLHDQNGHVFQGHASGDYRAQHASTGARTCPAHGIRVRASQNTIPHDSHQCCDVIVPFPAMRWPARLMCSLWQVGQRRSWVTGNSSLGGMAGGIPTWTSMMALRNNGSPLWGSARRTSMTQNICRPYVLDFAGQVRETRQ
jgi:hypothetical protein